MQTQSYSPASPSTHSLPCKHTPAFSPFRPKCLYFPRLSNWKQTWWDLRGTEGHVHVTAINLEFTIASFSPVEWIIVTEQRQALASPHTSLPNINPRWFLKEIWEYLGSLKYDMYHYQTVFFSSKVVKWRRRGWRMRGRMLNRREQKKRDRDTNNKGHRHCINLDGSLTELPDHLICLSS